ncbi:MAG: hypothetical protein M0Z85_03760 [Gammaproteobacteria bacterium]|nr:hypothetical protein [Gammaproteobacteria bacterium]
MKSAAERQAALRQRRAKEGLRQRVFWLTEDQAEKVKRFIERLVRGKRS